MRHAQHEPAVTKGYDGEWAVYCSACSWDAGDWVPVCEKGPKEWPSRTLVATAERNAAAAERDALRAQRRDALADRPCALAGCCDKPATECGCQWCRALTGRCDCDGPRDVQIEYPHRIPYMPESFRRPPVSRCECEAIRFTMDTGRKAPRGPAEGPPFVATEAESADLQGALRDLHAEGPQPDAPRPPSRPESIGKWPT